MVMHGGFKVSEAGGRLGEGRVGGSGRLSRLPAPIPSCLSPRPRPLYSGPAAAGKTTRDRCLTRRPLRIQLPEQRRGESGQRWRCAREGAEGPGGEVTPSSAKTLWVNLRARGRRESGWREAGLSGPEDRNEEPKEAGGGGRSPAGAEERVVSVGAQRGHHSRNSIG